MARRRSRRQKVQDLEAQPAAASSAPYDVEFSETAFAVYQSLHRKMIDAEKRGENSSSHHTVFRMIEEAVKNLIPNHPTDRNFGLKGPLSKFFRVKKGRHRICWAASSQHREVCILFISETVRKAGDANDPYNVFKRLVESGEYNDLLRQLDIVAKM
jgi:mRNA-degrading endonuclease RelE of RelBE toxin-antitoxin system